MFNMKRCFCLAIFRRSFSSCTIKQSSDSTAKSSRLRFSMADLEKKPFHSKKQRNASHKDAYKKKRADNIPVSNKVKLMVFGTGSHGQGRSIMLKTDFDCYLFNCGENVQKYLDDCTGKTGIVYNIFVTYNSWRNIGGLLGLMLSCTEHNIPIKPITIHGPKHVDCTATLTKMFAEKTSSKESVEWRGIEQRRYEDEQIIVDYVELHSDKSMTVTVPITQLNTYTVIDQDTGSPSPPAEEKVEQIDYNEKKAMAYIVKVKDGLPKVDLAKLRAMNIKPGRWISEMLTQGSVTVDDRVIKREDMCLKITPVGPVIVLDCPSLDYLESVISNDIFLNFEAQYNMPPDMIVHMSPVEVVNTPQYKQFMDRFQNGTKHLMLNENSLEPHSKLSTSSLAVLNLVHPTMFPGLVSGKEVTPDQQTGNIIQGQYLLDYTIRPDQKLTWTDVPAQFDLIDKRQQFEDIKEQALGDAISVLSLLDDDAEIDFWQNFDKSKIDDEFKKLNTKRLELEKSLEPSLSMITGCTEEYPEITFLGTGSAKPGMRRNASCILVQMRQDEYLFMDCGEGTLSQMYKMFGEEKTHHILSNTKAVFISHSHLDHHGGLFSLVEARQKVINGQDRKDALLVLAPVSLFKLRGLFTRYIASSNMPVNLFPTKSSRVEEVARTALGLKECRLPSVPHTGDSVGLVITHSDGWKLVYSGDCLPSDNLIKAGKDCDILIHEGTFDHSQRDHAHAKRHCTTSQAIEVATKMNARFTILTHFSQRFPFIPLFTHVFKENIGFAFDFMQVRPSQYMFIPMMKHFLNCLYGAKLRKNILRRHFNETAKGDSESKFTTSEWKTNVLKKVLEKTEIKNQRKAIEREKAEQKLAAKRKSGETELMPRTSPHSTSSDVSSDVQTGNNGDLLSDNKTDMETDTLSKQDGGVKRKVEEPVTDCKQARIDDVKQNNTS